MRVPHPVRRPVSFRNFIFKSSVLQCKTDSSDRTYTGIDLATSELFTVDGKMWRLTLLSLLAAFLLDEIHGYVSKYGYKDWVKYDVGNSSIILTAPHGGGLAPKVLLPRHNGCYDGKVCNYTYNCNPKSTKCKVTTVTDRYTTDIIYLIADTLRAAGVQPHVVVNNVKRIYGDMNREKNVACMGLHECGKLYDSYHGFIEEARDSIKGVVGLYFDVHGQSHKAAWTELGYRIEKDELNSQSFEDVRSSINHLKIRTGLSLKELVTGNSSFGAILSSYGYRVVPSPSNPSPGSEGYYKGGYCTKIYGSVTDGFCTDAIQFELPQVLRFDRVKRVKLAKDLASSILKFVKKYRYGDPSWKCGCSSFLTDLRGKVFLSFLLVMISLLMQ